MYQLSHYVITEYIYIYIYRLVNKLNIITGGQGRTDKEKQQKIHCH